jgi:putative oxidoreductase
MSTKNTTAPSSTAANLGLLLARAPLGAFFAIVSVGLIMEGAGKFVSKHMHLVPAVMPDQAGKIILYALPFIGVLVGMMIVVGAFTRMAGFLASLILAGIMFLVTGVFSAPPEPFHISVILLGVALLVFLVGGGGLSVDQMFLAKRKSSGGKE